MTLLLATVIALLGILLASPCLEVIATSLVNFTSKKQARKLSTSDLWFLDRQTEKIKRYAFMFGLTSEAHIDTIQLVKMGDKMALDLGEESTDYLFKVNARYHRDVLGFSGWLQEADVSPVADYVSVSHVVSRVISTTQLIQRAIVFSIQAIEGGDRDEEPANI